jgi:hypothetical protein
MKDQRDIRPIRAIEIIELEALAELKSSQTNQDKMVTTRRQAAQATPNINRGRTIERGLPERQRATSGPPNFNVEPIRARPV